MRELIILKSDLRTRHQTRKAEENQAAKLQVGSKYSHLQNRKSKQRDRNKLPEEIIPIMVEQCLKLKRDADQRSVKGSQ